MIKKILVVDTDKGNLNFLREKLDANNVVVKTAYGGEQALEMAAHEPFNLLIASVEMPKPHGVDVANALRSKADDFPVILISRNHVFDEAVQKQMRSMKNIAFLTKPVRVTTLYRTIEHLLHAKISWTERRISERIPMKIPIDISMNVRGKRPLFLNAVTDNISIGGLSFLYAPCDPCTGYIEGGVHDECLFAPAAHGADGIVAVTLHPEDGKWDGIVLHGQIANTRIINPGKLEIIGVTFSGAPPKEIDELRAFLKHIVKSRGE